MPRRGSPPKLTLLLAVAAALGCSRSPGAQVRRCVDADGGAAADALCEKEGATATWDADGGGRAGHAGYGGFHYIFLPRAGWFGGGGWFGRGSPAANGLAPSGHPGAASEGVSRGGFGATGAAHAAGAGGSGGHASGAGA